MTPRRSRSSSGVYSCPCDSGTPVALPPNPLPRAVGLRRPCAGGGFLRGAELLPPFIWRGCADGLPAQPPSFWGGAPILLPVIADSRNSLVCYNLAQMRLPPPLFAGRGARKPLTACRAAIAGGTLRAACGCKCAPTFAPLAGYFVQLRTARA